MARARQLRRLPAGSSRLQGLALLLCLASPALLFSAPRGRVALQARGGRLGQLSRSFSEGETVKALCPEDAKWQPGVIETVRDDGLYVVRWDNPELEPRHTVDPVAIIKREVYKDYKVGDEVLTYYTEDCMWYPGVVEEAKPDGSFLVRWDVPEDGLDEICVYPTHMKFPRLPADKLEMGRKYRGTVTSVQEYGAFVDIGADSLGLLHVSAMAGANARVERAQDLVTEGEDLDVWMAGFKAGKIVLTQRPGGKSKRNLMAFAKLPADQWQTGVVKATKPYGAFVTVSLPDGGTGDGLVPIEEISKDYIRRVEDVIKKGQQVSVRILSVDVVGNKMMLSMKGAKDSTPFNVSAFQDVSPEAWMSGRVVHATDLGAFVRLEHEGCSADGFLHTSQIAGGGTVRQAAPLGEDIRVRIITVNPARNRMKLSMLPLEETPAQRTGGRPPPSPAADAQPGRLVEDLKPFRSLVGQWLPGVVRQLRRNGVQVAVVSNTGAYALGMVFMNQIQDRGVQQLDEVLSPGQEVKVQVLSVNLQSKQMTLSMKGGFNYKKQDVRPFDGVSPTEWFPGTVEKVKDYGSFIKVRQGPRSAEGLLRKPETVGEPVPGDAVEVRVLGVDVEKGSMRLSMKPPMPEQTGPGAGG